MLKNKSNLEILGNGKQIKSYLDVRDGVNGVLNISEQHTNNSLIINLGHSQTMNVKDLADIVCDEMNLKKVEYKYTEGKEVGLRFSSCSPRYKKSVWIWLNLFLSKIVLEKRLDIYSQRLKKDFGNCYIIKSINLDLYFAGDNIEKSRKRYFIKKINFLKKEIFLLFINSLKIFLEGLLEDTPPKQNFINGLFT